MRYWPFILVLGIVFIGCAMMYESDDSDAYNVYWNATVGQYFYAQDRTGFNYVDEARDVQSLAGLSIYVGNDNRGDYIYVAGTPQVAGTYIGYAYVFDEATGDEGEMYYYVTVTNSYFTVSVYSAGGGTVSGGNTYLYGSTATISATPNTGYRFTNWSDGDTSNPRSFTVTGNVSLTAYFAINTYTVAWNNWDGTRLETDYGVPYGTTPSYNSATPTRSSTAQYIYTFTGWSPAVSPITGDVTYTAQYSTTLRTYTVTWNNWDGSTLETDLNVPYGSTPTYNGSTPTRSSTAQYTYTFTGWSPTVGGITGDTTYTAQYSSTVNNYTVTWNNWDGSTLETDLNVPYGTVPTYDGSTPIRVMDAQYTYTFSSWNPTVSAVTGNITYTAQYTSTLRSYTITWEDWDGTVLETDTDVPYGSTPAYNGSTPTKTSTIQYVYTFDGWSPGIAAVTGDATYTAQYIETIRTYIITWKNWNNTVLETDTTAYGVLPTYDGSTPTKPSTAQYTYTFDTWSPTVAAVTGDATYTAQYSSTVNNYTVTWLNWDETVLETDLNVPYGTMASYDGSTPTRTSTAQYSYTFTGWDPAISTVVGDTVYIAQFSPILRSYTITWENWDGTILETDTTAYGTMPSYDGLTPTRPSTSGYMYTFTSWAPQIVTVTGDATYTAQYLATALFTIVWKNWDGTVLETDTSVPEGTLPTYDGSTPTRPETSEYRYDFDGWYPIVVPATDDAEYTAQYTTTNLFTVVWRNWDGAVLETDTGVPDGTTPTYDGPTPTRPDTESFMYTFSGWDPAVGPIDSYTEYTAQYSSTALYLVTWLNWDGSVIDTDRIPVGTTPVYSGETPEKPMTIQYQYTFTGWAPTIVPITEDTSYTAQYSQSDRPYIYEDWTYYILDSGNIIVVGYAGTGGIVQIPYSMDDRVVVSIGDALKNNTDVTGIVIPMGVTTINTDAFLGTDTTAVLNLSGMEITETSYGLDNAVIYTSIPGWFYIADVEYTEKVPDNSSVSNMIRIIPILLIIGLILIIARNRVDSR